MAVPELLSAPDQKCLLESSCFRCVTVKEHLSLLPCFVGNLSKGIIEHLSGKILKYSALLNGVLLSYSRPTVMQKEGKILDEQPHIHFDLKYTVCIFRPILGSVLCGTVNKMGIDHIGCLLYDCFNVTVVCKGRKWHKSDVHTHNNFPVELEGGASIWFTVTSLDTTGDILSLTGEYFDCSEKFPQAQERKRKKKKKKRKKEIRSGHTN